MSTLLTTDALLVIDVQNDFCTGGALAVPDGEQVVPVINRLQPLFSCIALTQDWHPSGHVSFAGSHPGQEPFSSIELPYGPQVLWPAHCVSGTGGAEFHPGLDCTAANVIIRKGTRRQIDSYSAFYENDHQTPTGLAGWLRDSGIQRVFACGLATDFCVLYSLLDACRAGFSAVLIEDACRGIDLDGSVAAALARLEAAGVGRVTSQQLLAA